MLHSEILIPNITIDIFEGILYKLANKNHYEISVTQKSAEYHHILVKKENIDLVELELNTVQGNALELTITVLEGEDKYIRKEGKEIIVCEYPGFIDFMYRRLIDILDPSQKSIYELWFYWLFIDGSIYEHLFSGNIPTINFQIEGTPVEFSSWLADNLSSSFKPPLIQLGSSEIDHFEVSNYTVGLWPEHDNIIEVDVSGESYEVISRNEYKRVERGDEPSENEATKREPLDDHSDVLIIFYVSTLLSKSGFTLVKGLCTYPRLFSFMNQLEIEIPKMWNKFTHKDVLQNDDFSSGQNNVHDGNFNVEKSNKNESELPVWEQIPDHANNRFIIDLWCHGHTNSEISKQIRVSIKPRSVTNLICKLRKEYPQIPYKKKSSRRLIRRN